MAVRRETVSPFGGLGHRPAADATADSERTQPLAHAVTDATHSATLPVLQPATADSPTGLGRSTLLEEAADPDALRRRLECLETELKAVRAERDELRVDLQAAEELLRHAEARIRLSTATGDPPLDIDQAPPALTVGPGMRRLLMRDGDLEVVYPLGPRTTIGRSEENDIQVETRFVSRRHALICSTALETFIEDLGSTNGVYVNGRRIARQALRHGDQVLIGKTEFCFIEADRAS